MCLYCMVGDQLSQLANPPWPVYPQPYIPYTPVTSTTPSGKAWSKEDLFEAVGILERIKRLEEKLGCPCKKEDSKPDYIAVIRDALDKLETGQ